MSLINGANAVGPLRLALKGHAGLVDFIHHVRALSVGDEEISVLLEEISPYLPIEVTQSPTSTPAKGVAPAFCLRYWRNAKRHQRPIELRTP